MCNICLTRCKECINRIDSFKCNFCGGVQRVDTSDLFIVLDTGKKFSESTVNDDDNSMLKYKLSYNSSYHLQ